VNGFCIGFELSDDAVGIFRAVFGDPGFDSGSWRSSRKSCLKFKTSDFRCIRDFVKTAELSKMSGILKEEQQEGDSRDGKDALDNERP